MWSTFIPKFILFSLVVQIIVQAEDRAHRIGQTEDVKITFLHAKHTIDDDLWKMVIRKQHDLNDLGLVNEDLNGNFYAGNYDEDDSDEETDSDDDDANFQPSTSVRF